MPIRTLADVLEIERVPIRERVPEQNVYQRLQGVCERTPDHIAIRALKTGEVDEAPRDVTYRELDHKATQLANLLLQLGVGPGDVVSLLVPLLPESLIALFAAMRVAIVNPLNPFLQSEHLVGILREAGTSVLIASGESLTPELWSRVESIRAALPELKAVIRIGGASGPSPGVLEFEQATSAQPAATLIAERVPSRDDVAALFHTGGTTGRPKLVRHTHGGLLVAIWSHAAAMSDDPSEIALLGMPLFHVAGAIIMGLTPLCCGQTIILLTPAGLRNPTVVRNYWSLVERLRATSIGGVPTTLAALVGMPEQAADRSHIRYCFTGATALPVDTAMRFSKRFGLQIAEGYGMTEVHGYATVNPARGECRYGSVGLRLPYMELLIAEVGPSREVRRRCATGEIGHVLMRGPQVCAGYLDPTNHAEMFSPDGWLISGDLGRLDADGYLWITGRAKDLIIRGGHNIDPQLIEQVLHQHPAVELAAAVGRPDPYAGELPIAFVQLRAGHSTSAAELQSYCREHIPERAAVPVELLLIATMPLTAVGKIHKPTLRADVARRVFDREVATLADAGVRASVEIVDDAAHGTLARILIEDRGSLGQAAVEQRCRDLLGGYQLRHQVLFRNQP